MPSFKNELISNVGTVDTNILNCSNAAGSTLIGLTCANTTVSTINVSVKITSGLTAVFIVKNAIILPGASLIVLGGSQKIVLEQNDILSVVSSSAASCDVVLSYLDL
jgi:hypothetical protein